MLDKALICFQDILNRDPEDMDSRFYLASVYAMKGNIDVYSLFPILKMRLFNAPVIQWSKLKDSRNPYIKHLKNKKLFLDLDEIYEDKVNQEKTNRRDVRKRFVLLTLNLCWSIYEFIPFLGLVPMSTEAQREHIEEAISILQTIKFKDKKRQEDMHMYVAFLSMIQVINIFKDTFKDYKIRYPEHLLCVIDLPGLSYSMEDIKRLVEIMNYHLRRTKFKKSSFIKIEKVIKKMYEFNEKKYVFYIKMVLEKLTDIVCNSDI